jgi:hypothetical protein
MAPLAFVLIGGLPPYVRETEVDTTDSVSMEMNCDAPRWSGSPGAPRWRSCAIGERPTHSASASRGVRFPGALSAPTREAREAIGSPVLGGPLLRDDELLRGEVHDIVPG